MQHLMSSIFIWLALMALPVQAAETPYRLEVHDGASLQRAVPESPDLSRFTVAAIEQKLAALPAKPARVTVARIFKEVALGDFTDAGRAREWVQRQRSHPSAIFISGGRATLADIYRQLANPDWFDQVAEGVYIARLPIVIRPDATLLVRDNTLRLSTDRGAFLINDGHLFLLGSEVAGWNESTRQPMFYRQESEFRPFIVGWGGSETYAAGSRFFSLGYEQSKSYGMSFTQYMDTEQRSLKRAPPTGWLLESVFEDMYFGFYCYEAEDVVLLRNTFRNNIVYGIDPHDRSSRLLIADNTVVGTRKKHGIIVSREVSDSWIIRNHSHDNALSGIVLDRNSERNLIAWNDTHHNGGDGITLYESADNVIWENQVYANGRNGVRVRNSQGTALYFNRIRFNSSWGVNGQVKLLPDDDRDFEMDPYQPAVSLTLVGGELQGNGSGPVFMDDPHYMHLQSVDMRFPASALGLGLKGVLGRYQNEVLQALVQEGKAISLYPVDPLPVLVYPSSGAHNGH